MHVLNTVFLKRYAKSRISVVYVSMDYRANWIYLQNNLTTHGALTHVNASYNKTAAINAY